MQVVTCATSKDEKSRPAPEVVSSIFMQGGWTYHAFSLSHDGKTNIILLEDGIRVVKNGRKVGDYPVAMGGIIPRDVMWHPDSRRVAFWLFEKPPVARPGEHGALRRALAVLDTQTLPAGPLKPGEKLPYQIVYWSTPNATPYGVEWSPKGEAVFVLSRQVDPEDNQNYGVVTRVDLDKVDKPKDIVRVPGNIDFFMPPTSRFEHGKGPVSADYLIIYGHLDGLFVIDPEGKKMRRLSSVPAAGLYNLEWNPSPRTNEVALFFRRPVQATDGRMFTGVYLVDVNKAAGTQSAEAAAPEEGAAPAPAAGAGTGIEELYDGTDIHTLWCSPRGTYVCWANPQTVCFRRPADTPDKTVRITIPPTADGTELDIKGVAWHEGEQKLAITAQNRLYIYEVPTKDLYQVAQVGQLEDTFCAEPRWVGDQVILSAFEDAVRSKRIKPPGSIEFGTPQNPEDPTQGRGTSSAAPKPPAPAGTATPPKPAAGGQRPPNNQGGRRP